VIRSVRMAKAWRVLVAVLMLVGSGCGERSPPTLPVAPDAPTGPMGAVATAADAAPAADAASPDATPREPCFVMRDDAERAEDTWPRRRRRRLEAAARRFYRTHIEPGQEEHLRERMMSFSADSVASGALVDPCVADWRAAAPHNEVAGTTGRILASHTYVEAELHHARDELDFCYTLFMDADTLEVVAGFYTLVNTP
jgi:hypothetical protein